MIAIDSSRCTGCQSCALVCPHRVIDITNRQAVVAAEHRCIACGACELNCREDAISVTKGTGCLVVIAKEEWRRLRPGSGSSAEGSSTQPDCGCG